MINAAINILVYTGVFLIVGLINPQFTLFFMHKPTRLTVIIFALIAFMVAATLFGEGKRQQQVEQQTEVLRKAPQIQDDPNELPVTPDTKK